MRCAANLLAPGLQFKDFAGERCKGKSEIYSSGKTHVVSPA
ncbi:hypothetical protein AB3R30_02445 [Leptolyngbyaceae cyanobacterium UHCC 1019]